jgi:hypothetical protein
MVVSPRLHVSMPLRSLQIVCAASSNLRLTNLGTIQGGLPCRALLEQDILRCDGAIDDAALGHDYC